MVALLGLLMVAGCASSSSPSKPQSKSVVVAPAPSGSYTVAQLSPQSQNTTPLVVTSVPSIPQKRATTAHLYQYSFQLNFGYKLAKTTEEHIQYMLKFREKLPPNAKILSIEVLGHTDHIGGSVYNKKLAAERAKNASVLLVKHNFPKEKIVQKAKGDDNPVVKPESCTHNDKKQQIMCLEGNRRVVVNAIVAE